MINFLIAAIFFALKSKSGVCLFVFSGMRKFSLGEISLGGSVRGEAQAPAPPPMLVFRDVGVTIGKKVILQKICGLARVGQTLAVMGPSG